MKFGKKLKQQMEESLPDWRDSFISYKDLKKHVKLMSSSPKLSIASETYEFVRLLNREIDKLNAFFLSKEEDFIIRHKELLQRIESVTDTYGPKGSQPCESSYKDKMGKITIDVVDFHGEMVLLENYSSINYTGLAKILKKYDKRTGCLLRFPYIQEVLRQPFLITDLLSELVRDCEGTIDLVFPLVDDSGSEESKKDFCLSGAAIYRNSIAALLAMQEIRSGSSTYNHLSLPPLNLSDAEFLPTL